MTEELEKTFPYEYVGGGYFREKHVRVGVPAKIIHGDAIVSEIIKHTLENVDKKSI